MLRNNYRQTNRRRRPNCRRRGRHVRRRRRHPLRRRSYPTCRRAVRSGSSAVAPKSWAHCRRSRRRRRLRLLHLRSLSTLLGRWKRNRSQNISKLSIKYTPAIRHRNSQLSVFVFTICLSPPIGRHSTYGQPLCVRAARGRERSFLDVIGSRLAGSAGVLLSCWCVSPRCRKTEMRVCAAGVIRRIGDSRRCK